jgi:hypothetical protein
MKTQEILTVASASVSNEKALRGLFVFCKRSTLFP